YPRSMSPRDEAHVRTARNEWSSWIRERTHGDKKDQPRRRMAIGTPRDTTQALLRSPTHVLLVARAPRVGAGHPLCPTPIARDLLPGRRAAAVDVRGGGATPSTVQPDRH